MRNGIKVASITIKGGEDLFTKSGLSEYEGFVVTEINAVNNYVKFLTGITINLGEEVGGDRSVLMKIQIKEAIEEHFSKYSLLKNKRMKVLTLFLLTE